MKRICGKFFCAKVKNDRTQDDGLVRSVRDEYAVCAVSFTDCEAKLTKEIGSADNVKASFDVLALAVAPFKEVFRFDEGDTYYKVKVNEPYTDDYGKEKKTAIYYLLNAKDFENARQNAEEIYKGTTIEHEIAAIIEQKIIDVLE